MRRPDGESTSAPGQKRRGISKYNHFLEEDRAFRAWYRNVLRGSYNTGAWYLLRMGRLCDELTGTTPARIAAMNRAELMTFVSGFVSDLEEAGVSGVTIGSYVKAVKSWARFNGTRLDEKVNVPESDARYAGDTKVISAPIRALEKSPTPLTVCSTP